MILADDMLTHPSFSSGRPRPAAEVVTGRFEATKIVNFPISSHWGQYNETDQSLRHNDAGPQSSPPVGY